MFKQNLALAEKEIEKVLAEELDNSLRRLKRLLASKIKDSEMSDASLERRLNYIISSMKFPSADLRDGVVVEQAPSAIPVLLSARAG